MAEAGKTAEEAHTPVVAVFASDRGPGDAERASIMSQSGSFLARRGARIVCMSDGGGLCVPLINSAVAAGGQVEIVAATGFAMPSALSKVSQVRIDDRDERHGHIAEACQALIGLPGSLASVTALYETWLGTGSQLPVALLNRNRAYEVLRGFGTDLLGHSVRHWERKLIVSETIEDLWHRLARVLK